MIFKTFKQSLEDVYIAGRKINKRNNLKLTSTNITGYTTTLRCISFILLLQFTPYILYIFLSYVILIATAGD